MPLLQLSIVEDADQRKKYAFNPALGRLTHITDEPTLNVLVGTGALGKEHRLYWGQVRDLMIGSGLTNAEAAEQFERAQFASK